MDNEFHQRFFKGAATAVLLLVACPGIAIADEKAKLAEQFKREIEPILVNYCYDCHGDGSDEGHLALDDYGSIEEMIADREEWKKIRDHIDFRLMPPPDEYAPEDAERAKLVRWIDDAVFPVDASNPDPGHVTLRRLNRAEYQNTIQDLLGVEVDVISALPVDDSGYGFDNIGDVLTLSPLHMERYLEVAETALDAAVDFSPESFPQVKMNGRDLDGDGDDSGEGHVFASNGVAEKWFKPKASGMHRIRIIARADQAGEEPAKMEFRKNGEPLNVWEVQGDESAEYSFDVLLDGGQGFKIGVAFLNDYYNEAASEGRRDRNLEVETMIMEGPLDGPAVPRRESHTAIFGKGPEGKPEREYMSGVMRRYVELAFRRPAKEGEAERYLVFLDQAKAQGQSVEYAIRQALAVVLASPSFLFREEPVLVGSGDGKALIDEHALASRLSYFLWSSMPDARLKDLADKGELRKNLPAEIRRMVESGKSSEFVANFVGQWLQLRDMEAVSPNENLYGSLGDGLREAMRKETELLVEHVMKENLPIQTLMSADFTFVNERLAGHYGLQGVKGSEFRRVSLKDTPRRGILGHASVLTLTSHTSRTSPVLRGKYVLENLFNTPPPPAPPNVPALESEGKHGESDLTLRQELEEHRKNPACASCHALMDPIGFGMENYDAVGRWRTQDREKQLDVSGKLVTGQEFSSPEELQDIFINDYRKEFHRAVAVKMLTYALGRGVEYYDRPAIDEIVLKAGKDDGRFLSWVTSVAESVPFQYRRK